MTNKISRCPIIPATNNIDNYTNSALFVLKVEATTRQNKRETRKSSKIIPRDSMIS